MRTDPSHHQELWKRLTSSRTAPDFFRSWLELVCTSLDGATSAVLVARIDDKAPFAPVGTWPEGSGVSPALAKSAEQTLREARTTVAQCPADESGKPTWALCHPIASRGQLHGVVAVELSERPGDDFESVVRALDWGSVWLPGVLGRLTPREPDPESAAAKSAGAQAPRGPEGDGGERIVTAALPRVSQTEKRTPQPAPVDSGTATATATAGASAGREAISATPHAVLDIVSSTASSGSLDDAARILLDELATRTVSQRASLGFVVKGQAKIFRTSSPTPVERGGDLWRAIECAMDEILDQGVAIAVPTRVGGASITRAHEALARRCDGHCLSVPLRFDTRVTGVITLERHGGEPYSDDDVRVATVSGDIAGPLLELERREERTLPRKCLDSFATSLGRLIGPRNLLLKSIGIVVLVAVIVACIVRIEYRVAADTVLEGAAQRVAVAPFDGFIRKAERRAGDEVTEGDVLAELDDRDLRLERLKLVSEQQQLSKQYDQFVASREIASANVTRSQIDRVKAQLALVEVRLERTRLTSPMDARIISGDLSQSIGAPVARGDVLFQLAPLNAFRVIFEVDERDIADVEVGQTGTLLLTSFPDRSYPIEITTVTPVSTPREGRNYFRVEADVSGEVADLRPGMEGVGKVGVGSRSVAWIITHRAIDWLRLKLWSWLP